MAILTNLSDFNIEFHENNIFPHPRDKYYRFRLSIPEKEQLEANKRYLRKNHNLKLSDVVRDFALNHTQNDMFLSEMRLIWDDPRYIKYRLARRTAFAT